jgi:hypothetical protein
VKQKNLEGTRVDARIKRNDQMDTFLGCLLGITLLLGIGLAIGGIASGLPALVVIGVVLVLGFIAYQLKVNS